MKLYIHSVVVSCLVIIFLIFFSIIHKQKEYIDDFNKEYKYSLLKEKESISSSLSKLVQNPVMKHSIENNLDNSLSKSLDLYSKNNLSVFLLQKDCSSLYSSSRVEGIEESLCSYINDNDSDKNKEVSSLDSSKYFSYKDRNYILEQGTIISSTKNINIIVLSEINSGFIGKYPSLSSLYKKLDIFIDTNNKKSKFFASYIGSLFVGSGSSFISKKIILKVIPSFIINNLFLVFSLGLVCLVFLLLSNNFMIFIKLYRDRVKLNIDMRNFFDWINTQSINFSSFLSKNSFINNIKIDSSEVNLEGRISDNNFSETNYSNEKILEKYKNQILLFISQVEKEIEKNMVRINSLENKLKKQDLKNKTLSIQLSYFSEIESFYIQSKRLFYSLLSKMEDINVDIQNLNTISQEVFGSFGNDFFNILNSWKTNIEQRGVKRFLRYLSEIEVDKQKTLLDFQLESLIDSGTKIYSSSSSVINRLNQIFVSMSEILKIFSVWEKYLSYRDTITSYDSNKDKNTSDSNLDSNKSESRSILVSSSILDAQALIKQEELTTYKESEVLGYQNDTDSCPKVEFVNYNISIDDISKDISETTLISFMYHIYLSYLKVAKFLNRDIKIYTGFKTNKDYVYLIVGSNIKESFSENILSKFSNIQKLDLDISSRIVEGFNISRINFVVSDTLSNVGYSWKSLKIKDVDKNIKEDSSNNVGKNIEDENLSI